MSSLNDIQSAIDAGKELGGVRSSPYKEGEAMVIVPTGTELKMLDRPDNPHHRHGTVALHDRASFIEYWGRQHVEERSYIYGSMQPAQFTAIFNEHVGGDTPCADWRDHRALLVLNHSPEWLVWLAMNGKVFEGNEELALWLEDNLPDVTDPQPAKLLETILNIKVKQGVSFANKVDLTSGEFVLSFDNSVEATARVGASTVKLPQQFKIKIPVWAGLDEVKYELTARFRYRQTTNGDSRSVKFYYELIRPAKVIEQAFKDALATIQKESGTVVLFGVPEISK